MGWDYFPGHNLDAGINRILDTLTFTNGEAEHKLELFEKVGNVVYCVSSVVGDVSNVPSVRYASVIVCQNDKIDGMPTGRYGYKVMHECEHPYYYDIPERLFDSLTPTKSKYAKAWRDKVHVKLYGLSADEE